MQAIVSSWLFWALLSAVFAALTAVFAKAGVAQVDSDLATWLRTLVVAVVLGALVALAGKLRGLTEIPGRAALFLILSGLATGASWLCYFRALSLGDAARVAPVDKLSVVLVAVFAATFLGEMLSPLAWAGVALIGLGAALVALG
ncbi:transporter family protein [Rhodobacter aestuarii]|uniref:Transporter family protein n=1 Tax=Rhodobacter aestuarii TaxID=453582 RepID=A0A1N7M5A2_9RHOB|nr:EamA family transporter [Rhodobacter aestuarii]PTV94857.1 transporter family protein [Rhodobacter aestuarii]SIS81296.1 transporter family protein [Rhodobacter aestuarii]